MSELLINMTSLSSILTILGVIVIITFTMKFKIRNYFASLLYYLSVANLIFAIGSLGTVNSTNTGFVAYILDFLSGFGFYSSILWTSCILLHSYFCVKHSLPLRKYEKICHYVCFGIPLILSTLVLIFSPETFSGLLPAHLSVDTSQWIFKIIPMVLSCLFMIVIGTLMVLALKKEGFDLSKRNDEAQNARDFLIFPILLIITWVPATIFMISFPSSQSVTSVRADTSSQGLTEGPSDALAAADAFLFGLQGFLNSLFNFCTYEVRKKLFGEYRGERLTTRLLENDPSPFKTGSALEILGEDNTGKENENEEEEERHESQIKLEPQFEKVTLQRNSTSVNYEENNIDENGITFTSQANLQRDSEYTEVRGSPGDRVSTKSENNGKENDRPTGILKAPSRDPTIVSKKPVTFSPEENLEEGEEKKRDSPVTETQTLTSKTMKTEYTVVQEVSPRYEVENEENDEPEAENEQEVRLISEEDYIEEPKQELDHAQYEIAFRQSNIPFRRSLAPKKTIQVQQDDRISALEKQVLGITEKLEAQGVKEIGMVLGIDCTSSNITSGKKSFGQRPLHHISKVSLNFYEQVIGILGSIVNRFSRDGRFPVYLFGDGKTRGHAVRPLYIDPDDESHECYGIEHVLQEYRKKIRRIELSGPTSFKPLIEKALEIIEVKGDFQVLVIVGDGELTDVEQTRAAIIKASDFPLSIIMVGVGDGDVKAYPKDPWLGMKKFEKSLPGRKFENFTFVHYEKGMEPETFAECALRHIPSAYMYCVENDLVSEKGGSIYSP